MALDLKIHSGVVRNWSVVHSGTHVTYNLIEFEGGKKLVDVRAEPALSEILEPALKRGEPLNLHVANPVPNMPAALIAFEEQGRGIFATDVPPLPVLLSLGPRLALIFGILLIPAFGLGILILGAWSTMRNNIRPLVELREYVQSLPRATLVK